MRSIPLTLKGSEGLILDATLDRPAGSDPLTFALFAHCFTCTKDFPVVSRISRALARERIAVLRFDFTGLGKSEGDFSQTGFFTNVGDVVAAAAFLRTEFSAPTLLLGHSLGGAAVLAAAHRIPEVKGVVTDAMSPVTHAEFSVDGEEWRSAGAEDEILDSPRERLLFQVEAPDSPDGERLVRVRASDRAGNLGMSELAVGGR